MLNLKKVKNLLPILILILTLVVMFCSNVLADSEDSFIPNFVEDEGMQGDLKEDTTEGVFPSLSLESGLTTLSVLPESIDLSSTKYFPPIGQQQGGSVIKELGQQTSLNGNTGSYNSNVLVSSISLNKTSSTLGINESDVLTARINPNYATN